MVTCPECELIILSDRVPACPDCGADIGGNVE